MIYSNANGIEAWQGIRRLDDNFFLTCGTNTSNQGVLNIGPIINYNSANNYIVMYPGSASTSVYGPDYIGGGYYRLVGSYKKDKEDIVYGFFFQGKITDLSSSANYKTIITHGNYTYIHSTMGNILVGNYDDIKKHNTFGLPLGPGSAFLYIISEGKKIDITYPGSLTNTVYGVWHNGGSSYTFCGGYSNKAIPITSIYTATGILPIGNAYIVNYDIENNTFSNWISINYPNNTDIVTHFQGISSVDKSNPQSYQFAADSLNTSTKDRLPAWVSVSVDITSNFYVDQWVNLKYPLPLSITSSNSVADNIIVGIYIEEDGTAGGYQVQV